jgi:hypothetical protein
MTLIDCRGTGLERGRAHGESARAQVVAAVDHWAQATLASNPSAASIEQYAKGMLSSTGLLNTATRQTPDLVDEVRGIAEGAGLPFEVIAAYNFMDEQWWFDLPTPPPWEPGCSVLGHTTGQRTVLAQHMDLPAFMDGSQVVLRLAANDQPEALVLSAAGLIGLTGVNRAGVGVCVNTLLMLRHNPNGLPVAFALRHALAQHTAEAADQALHGLDHASGQHYLVGDRHGLYSQECSAGGCAVGPRVKTGTVSHTNHPLHSQDINPQGLALLESVGRVANSEARLACLDDNRALAAEASAVMALLSRTDVPLAIKPGPRTRTQTFGSVVFELADQTQASFCLGQPGTQPWQQVRFLS